MRRAYDRDDAEINQWKEESYPKIKQLAKKQGAEIFWLDEGSVRPDDRLMRTWGLKGLILTVQSSGNRQGMNAISVLSNTGGLWYHVYTEHFNSDVFIECLIDHSIRKKTIFVIMDGHPVYKSTPICGRTERKTKHFSLAILCTRS